MGVVIQQIPNGKWKENCYIVHNESLQALMIDPGSEVEPVIEYIETQQLEPLAILNTHAHYDHIGIVSILKERFNLPFYLHSSDSKLLKQANLYRKIFDGDAPVQIPEVDIFVDHCDGMIQLGSFAVQAIETPGHTPGGVSFLIEKHLFTGDTLFKKKIGRFDFPGGKKETLFETLKTLSLLPPDIMIYPGHGATSVIQEELEVNLEWLEAIQ